MIVTTFSMLLAASVLMYHSQASGYFETNLSKATELLEAVGASGLCHPSSNDFYPFFPLCGDFELSEAHDQPRQLEDSGGDTGPEDANFYIYNGVCAFICVCIAALAAGLTLGLLSLDPLNLLIKMRTASSEQEKQQAASLLPIVRQHHLLLVTLLLLNSMANEALPLFLDKIVPGYMAIILSVTLVLFFGEIIPSAIFTGPQRIKIASSLAPVVRLVMCTLYPIAYPISKLLDILLHDEEDDSAAFSRGELAALVRIQYEERLGNKKRRKEEKIKAGLKYSLSPSNVEDQIPSKAGLLSEGYNAESSIRHTKREVFHRAAIAQKELGSNVSETTSILKPKFDRASSLHRDEVSMIQGALNMKTKVAMDVYTAMRNVFAISYDTILTEANTVEIFSSGYSRVPVYIPRSNKKKCKTGVVGVLLTKQLIVVNDNENRPISTLPLQIPHCVSPIMNLVDLINLFQSPVPGSMGGHMAIVCARPHLAEQALSSGQPIPENAGVMGVVTLEDCIEELLQEQIYDEMDRTELAKKRVALWAYRKWKLYIARRKLQREEEAIHQLHQPDLIQVVEAAKALGALEKGEGTPLLGQTTEGQPKNKSFFGLF